MHHSYYIQHAAFNNLDFSHTGIGIVTGCCLLPLARAPPFNKTELRHSEIPVFPLLPSGWVPIPKWKLLPRQGNMVDRVVMFPSWNSESQTMNLYLAGINSYKLDLGIECAAFADPPLERTILGINRDHLEPERRIQTPLTQPHHLLNLHHLSRSNYNHVATQAAFTLAFAGFLPVGEFTYKQRDLTLGDAFPKWFFTKSSVRVRGRGAYMEITLPSSKTDQFRKGIKLTIAASLDNP